MTHADKKYTAEEILVSSRKMLSDIGSYLNIAFRGDGGGDGCNKDGRYFRRPRYCRLFLKDVRSLWKVVESLSMFFRMNSRDLTRSIIVKRFVKSCEEF